MPHVSRINNECTIYNEFYIHIYEETINLDNQMIHYIILTRRKLNHYDSYNNLNQIIIRPTTFLIY